ncbi:hypothetical protein [Corynebacterium aurimucosum]|uniref:hypothetical protein n=1 Tax=Corynebacterium aurimucosum TaxID=169292 RepID=UPI003990A648
MPNKTYIEDWETLEFIPMPGAFTLTYEGENGEFTDPSPGVLRQVLNGRYVMSRNSAGKLIETYEVETRRNVRVVVAAVDETGEIVPAYGVVDNFQRADLSSQYWEEQIK